jgi:hypothetical protein
VIERRKLAERITKWWNEADHDFLYSDFEECLDEVLYCYVEKKCFRETGVVDDLSEWRSERSICYQMMQSMEKTLKKEVLYCYDSSGNDPEIIPIPKEPQFEAWKSFSIVSREVNCYGFGDEIL